MAIFTPGASVSEISGSIANVTYSRNRGGAYTKTKMIQTNPNSPAQVAARALTTAAVAAWKLLSPAVQLSWINFANTQESKPILSKTTKLSGYTSFIRFHITRNRFGLSGNPLPVVQKRFRNFFNFSFNARANNLSAKIRGTNNDPDILIVFYLSEEISPGRTVVPESKCVIMEFAEAPNGMMERNLTQFWIDRFGPLTAAISKKIFCRIEVVNRRTAQSLTLFRGSSVYAEPLALVVVTVPLFGNMTSRSLDSFTWTTDTIANNNSWKAVSYSPSLNIFCAVSDTNTGTAVMRSSNAINWTVVTTPLARVLNDVRWIPFLNLFIATCGDLQTLDVLTSPNGLTWTARATGNGQDIHGIAFNPTGQIIIVAVPSNLGNAIFRSTNGTTWTRIATPNALAPYGVTWSPSLGIFVAVGLGTTTYSVMTSPDGLTWTARTTPIGYFYYSVAWSEELQLFAAVANQNGTDLVTTSPDGITWTIRTTPDVEGLLVIVWSDLTGRFVVTAPADSPTQIVTSPNGIDWNFEDTPGDGLFTGIVAL